MAKIFTIKGTAKGDMKIPAIFSKKLRKDLIQRSVVAEHSQRRQRQSIDSESGFRTSASYFGSRNVSYRQTINRAMSRLPREKPGGGGLGKVRRVPQSVGGHRAHPPKGKDYSKKINKKEWKNALHTAIAATNNLNLIRDRGHKVNDKIELPIIIEDAIQDVKKTSEIIKIFKSIGLSDELERCRSGDKTGLLLVIAEDNGVRTAAGNLPGIEVASLNDLSVELLAPGTHPGRLTIWSESALKNLSEDGTI